jgi:transcriptional regulator GlxA family with amidase domain
MRNANSMSFMCVVALAGGSQQRWLLSVSVWSSAGVSAGTDLMLAFIASVAGDEAAGKVQFAAEYYPSSKRYGGYENHEKAPAYLKTS